MLKHLRELMEDAEMYEWEPVWAYHAAWLQQIENGWADWKDVEIKIECRRALVLNVVQHWTAKAQPSNTTRQKACKEADNKSGHGQTPVLHAIRASVRCNQIILIISTSVPTIWSL